MQDSIKFRVLTIKLVGGKFNFECDKNHVRQVIFSMLDKAIHQAKEGSLLEVIINEENSKINSSGLLGRTTESSLK